MTRIRSEDGMAVRRRPPRITLLTHSYWPESSPPQRRWSAFVQEMRAADWQVDVITPVAHAPHGRRDLPEAMAGRPLRVQRGPYLEVIRRVPFLRHSNSHLSRFLDQCFSAFFSIPVGFMARASDVLIVTAPSLPILGAGYVLARLRGIPLVVEMRDAWPDLAQDARIVHGNVKSVAERAVDFVQRRADLVVTVTEGFAETLRRRGLKNVATISNGVRLDTLPYIDKPRLDQKRLEVLYLGNHGESQRLEVVIEASALVGASMHLHMVGHGVRRPALERLAKQLNAPVTFNDALSGQDVIDRYASADTCIVSLRDDWKSFETTVPSKTYEVLAIGRHVTAIVKGEAARIIREAGAGEIIASNAEAVADLWRRLAEDRRGLLDCGIGRQWVQDNADFPVLAGQYMVLIQNILESSAGKRS